MKILITSVLLCAALLVSCDQPEGARVADNDPLECTCGRQDPQAWKPGDLDDDGQLVVFVTGGQYRVLETDYALVFLNVGDEEHPEAGFAFASQERGYEEFDCLNALITRLVGLPVPRVVGFYGNCGAPPFWGLPQPEIDRFFAAVDAAGVQLRELRPNGQGNFVCTCPCSACNQPKRVD